MEVVALGRAALSERPVAGMALGSAPKPLADGEGKRAELHGGAADQGEDCFFGNEYLPVHRSKKLNCSR